MKRALFGLVAALAGAACHLPIDGADFEVKTAPPLPVTVSRELIEIPVGIGVGITVIPTIDGEKNGTAVRLRSGDPSVLGVLDAKVGSRDFILFGVAPGSGRLYVEDKGEFPETGDIEATVEVPFTVVARP